MVPLHLQLIRADYLRNGATKTCGCRATRAVREIDKIRKRLATAEAALRVAPGEDISAGRALTLSAGVDAVAPGRNRVLRTALRALAVLRSGRWRIDELAAELGYGRRQAYRMITALRAAGIAVEVTHEGVEAYYRVTREAVESVLHAAPKSKETP